MTTDKQSGGVKELQSMENLWAVIKLHVLVRVKFGKGGMRKQTLVNALHFVPSPLYIIHMDNFF